MSKKDIQQIKDDIIEIKKQYGRMNALDVHVKRLLQQDTKMKSLLNSPSTKDPASSVKSYVSRNINPIQLSLNNVVSRLEKVETWQKQQTVDQAKEKKSEPLNPFLTYIEELNNQIKTLIQKNEYYEARLKQVEEKLANMYESKHSPLTERDVVIKEIHIDKFYLDKYEQSNNFAQLGIKELSGALNIGATYGKDVIPKEWAAEIKEELEDMKGIKEDCMDQATENESDEEERTEESEPNKQSDRTSSPHEKSEDHFTEIEIDDGSGPGLS